MTSHVLYADEARNANASVGQSAKLTPNAAPASSTSVVRQFLDLVKAVYADPAAASEQNHPWLDAVIKSHMSSRAHRLMRSDY
jgi:uncharacterized iron-regulated protein